MKLALSILLLCALFVSCNLHWVENKMPGEAVTALHTQGKVILYSLEPWEQPATNDATFYQYKILGQTTLEGPSASTALTAFESAIPPRRRDYSADCFDPRHAIRVTSQGHTYDFLLCYACGGLVVYRDDTNFAEVAASGSPAVLNDLLTAAKIPLAMSPHSSQK